MDLSTYGDLITNLTSKNSDVKQACWDGVSGELGTQDFSWHKSNTGVKGRNIHLGIVVTHITGHYFEPGDDNTRVNVPEKILYHKDILGKWPKEHCLTAPVTFNQGDGQWSLNIPIEGDRYRV